MKTNPLNLRQLAQYNQLINSIDNRIRSINHRRKSRSNSAKHPPFVSTSFGQQAFKIVKKTAEKTSENSPPLAKKFKLPKSNLKDSEMKNILFENSPKNKEKIYLAENLSSETDSLKFSSLKKDTLIIFFQNQFDEFKISLVKEIGELVNKWLTEYTKVVKESVEKKIKKINIGGKVNIGKELKNSGFKIEECFEKIKNLRKNQNLLFSKLDYVESLKTKIGEEEERKKNVVTSRRRSSMKIFNLEKSMNNVEEGIKRLEKSLEIGSEKRQKKVERRKVRGRMKGKLSLRKLNKAVKRKKKRLNPRRHRKSLSLIGVIKNN